MDHTLTSKASEAIHRAMAKSFSSFRWENEMAPLGGRKPHFQQCDEWKMGISEMVAMVGSHVSGHGTPVK